MRFRYTIITAAILLIIALTLGAIWTRHTARRRQILAALPSRVPILMYHDIAEEQTPATANDVWAVQVEVFESHLQSLREQGYTGILPDDLVAAVKGQKKLPDKPIIISFDDGFLSNMKVAEPLLKQYGFPAIIYLITAKIADSTDQRQYYRGKPCLIWPEVRDMMQRGTMSFGVHSHTHPTHPSNTALEVTVSPNWFRARTGVRPYSFCYPHGQYNEEAVRAVADAGFTTAMVCKDEPAIIDRDTNLLVLPRVSVFGGIQTFALEILPAEKTGPGRAGVKAANLGRTLPVTPRLLGAGLPPEQEWLPDRRLCNRPQEWIWPVPDHINPEDLRLEIWDRHRILLLFSAP